MTIYQKPTKSLMLEFARECLKPGQVFDRTEAIDWFAKHYPKINPKTVEMHVEGMAVNNPVRKHHTNIKPGAGFDLFFKVGPRKFRLWEQDRDPLPRYRADIIASENGEVESASESASLVPTPDGDERARSDNEFAFERDLQNYLVKNLSSLEEGLTIYRDEEFTGVEYPVGGRYIDILAVDAAGGFVVIELKVSRGYDRTIGQLLRYMGWVRQNLASGKQVRGIIVASDITEDLKLAASQIENVRLVEYEISFRLRPL